MHAALVELWHGYSERQAKLVQLPAEELHRDAIRRAAAILGGVLDHSGPQGDGSTRFDTVAVQTDPAHGQPAIPLLLFGTDGERSSKLVLVRELVPVLEAAGFSAALDEEGEAQSSKGNARAQRLARTSIFSCSQIWLLENRSTPITAQRF
eukprot:SAG31_NODE_8236_length_1492_cov_1.305097_1_plen_151_part_00